MRDQGADRRVDAATAVLCNVALPGIGYLLLRRPVLAAMAFAGMASIGLLMFNSPGAGSGPVLLFLWWSAITIHTVFAVRGRWLLHPPGQGVSV
jgi:hypothetical protein